MKGLLIMAAIRAPFVWLSVSIYFVETGDFCHVSKLIYSADINYLAEPQIWGVLGKLHYQVCALVTKETCNFADVDL